MWSITSKEQADAPDPPLKPGVYLLKVKSQEILLDRNGNNYLRIKMREASPSQGTLYVEDVFFDGKGANFYKRESFWKSAGHPEMVNSHPEAYIDQVVKVLCEVETYFSEKKGVNMEKLAPKEYIVSLPDDDMADAKDNELRINSNSIDFPDEGIPF